MSDRISQPTLRAMQIARIKAERDELLALAKDAQCHCPTDDCNWCTRRRALIARIEGGK